MSAKGILEAAYRAHVVPDHLKGKTQQKTLQARLSEDILYHRASSLFYRTEPGIFFLCELISDPDIPDRYKEKFPARRRTRDLQRDNPLGISRTFLEKWGSRLHESDVGDLFRAAEKDEALKYLPESGHEGYASVWTFSLVRRNDKVLSYRIGRYRDDRDSFANKRTVGFPGALTISDTSLFSQQDYGATDNALSVLLLDLDLSPQSFDGAPLEKPESVFAIETDGDDGISILLLVLEWTCPNWFEPTTRRLSLNDPCWLDFTVLPNNIDDFEPWSRRTLCRAVERDRISE